MNTRRQFLTLAACCTALAATGALAAERRAFETDAFHKAQAEGKSILVEIHAPWCPTCKAQQPILESLLSDPKYVAMTVFRIDFDSQKAAVRALKATSQSTLITFKGKQETGRSVGDTASASIAALLDSAL